MSYKLLLTQEAAKNIKSLENPALVKRFKAVKKALRFLAHDPRHPSLNTHKYSSFVGPNDEEVFEAYAENKTPGAYRIFWFYGPEKSHITIIAVTPHP